MSWFDGVPAASLYVGPPQDYPAAAASSASAQSLVTGASGGYSQPNLPVGLFPMDKQGRAIIGHMGGKLTMASTSYTAIFSIGLATSPNSISGTTLFSTPAITVGSVTANLGWELDFKTTMRGAGYGTTSVSTSLLTSGVMSINTLQSVGAPTLVTNIDSSVQQWLYATVTFSTASTTNSATLQSLIVYAMA